jgi:hypothetical protein
VGAEWTVLVRHTMSTYPPTCDHSLLQEKAPAVTDYLFAINEKLGEAVRAVPVSTAAVLPCRAIKH